MCRLGVALQPWLVHPIQIKFECFIFFLNLNVLIFSYLNLLQNSLVLTGCMIMFFDGFKTCFVLMGWMKLVWLLTKHWYNSGAKRSTRYKINALLFQIHVARCLCFFQSSCRRPQCQIVPKFRRRESMLHAAAGVQILTVFRYCIEFEIIWHIRIRNP